MSDTPISWTHRPGTRGRSWNPVQGCAMVSDGCRNCYAMRQARRFARDGWSQGLVDLKTGKWTGETKFAMHRLSEPFHWKASTVFVNSMSDLFYEGFTNEQIAAVFGVMAATPQHTYIILTKRAQRMREWFAWLQEHGETRALRRCGDAAQAHGAGVYDLRGDPPPPPAEDGRRSRWNNALTRWPLPNVWLGVSVENQEAAEERVPDLMATPAVIRLLSCEPLLGALDLTDKLGTWTSCPDCGRGVSVDEDGCCTGCGLDALHYGVDWVIAGCESGPGARVCDVAWLRSLRDQCAKAQVPFFLKQAEESTDCGEDRLEPENDISVAFGDGSVMKARRPKGNHVIEGAYLDGVQHKAFPEVRA